MKLNEYYSVINLLKVHLDIITVDFLIQHLQGRIIHEWVTYRDPERNWFQKDYIPVLDGEAETIIGGSACEQRYFIMKSEYEDKYLNKFFESLVVHHENIPYNEIEDNLALNEQVLKWKDELYTVYDRGDHIKVTLWNILRREFNPNVRSEVEQYARKILSVPQSYNFAEFTCEGMNFEIIDYARPAVRLKSISGVWGNLTHYRSNRPILPNQERIDIPKKLYSIWLGEFYIVEIGRGVFDNIVNCRELYLPISISKIEWGFWNCKQLERIEVPHNPWENPRYISIDGVLYTSDGKTLLAYPNAHGAVYEVPEGVSRIGKFAFKSCDTIQQVTLPSTIERIEVNAFYRCANLKSILCNMSQQLFVFEGFIGDDGNIKPQWYFTKDVFA